jgi:glutamine amidotransferase
MTATLTLLPGVGSFAQGMENLYERNLVDLLTEEVLIKQKPFLGICLGMQLIMETTVMINMMVLCYHLSQALS